MSFARLPLRSVRLAPRSVGLARRNATNIPPVGSGSPDAQTTTTSARPSRGGSSSPLPYVLALVVLAGGAYLYLQEDPKAAAKVKSEAQSAENKAKELYDKSKSEAKSVFGQTENKARSASRDIEGRGEDILDSAKARAKDAEKDIKDGWFKFKEKTGDAAADARDALNKMGDTARSDFRQTEDKARSLWDSARSKADSSADAASSKASAFWGKAEREGNKLADEGRRWWHFGSLERRPGEFEAELKHQYYSFGARIDDTLDRAGNRLQQDVRDFRKEGEKAESTASSWFSSAKSKADNAKISAQSKL